MSRAHRTDPPRTQGTNRLISQTSSGIAFLRLVSLSLQLYIWLRRQSLSSFESPRLALPFLFPFTAPFNILASTPVVTFAAIPVVVPFNLLAYKPDEVGEPRRGLTPPTLRRQPPLAVAQFRGDFFGSQKQSPFLIYIIIGLHIKSKLD